MLRENHQLVNKLANRAIELLGESKQEIERTCWMVVHEYKHGVKPTEYDVREIDEDLYLLVLAAIKTLDQRKN